MKIKKIGYCCDEFKEAYENGYNAIGKKPSINDLYIEEEYCIFCGNDPSKYLKDKKFINEV